MREIMPYIFGWKDVVFAALLLGLASYAFEREHSKASDYASFYESYCRQSWQRYHERENEDQRWRERESESIKKTKADTTEKNRQMLEALQREGDKKCSQLQKKLSGMMSVKEHLEKRFDHIYDLTEAMPPKFAPLVNVRIMESTVKISYSAPTKSRGYQLTFFNRQGLVTGELKFSIKPSWGIFGGGASSTNEREETCPMRNGDPVYYAVRTEDVE